MKKERTTQPHKWYPFVEMGQVEKKPQMVSKTFKNALYKVKSCICWVKIKNHKWSHNHKKVKKNSAIEHTTIEMRYRNVKHNL